MQNRVIKLGVAAAALALANSASAEVKINDSLATSGYAAGSYRMFDASPGESTDRFDVDAVKSLFTYSSAPVTGVVSLYYVPDDINLLDAYASYNAGGGFTLTGGKFLSYLGYEAFDLAAMDQLTYANGDFLGVIPGYHSGLKLDYSDDTLGYGLAVVDSVYSKAGGFKGDGELKRNGGFEGYVTYKGIKDLTLWTGFAYDTEGNYNPHSIFVWNLWASYAVSSQLRVAGEVALKDGGEGDKGYNWLAFANYSFSDKFSTAFRLSGEDIKDGASFTKYTLAPSYAVTPNLVVRAEYSFQDYKDFSADSANFIGVQTLFKW